MALKSFHVLVLPSGAATGIVSSTILAQLEQDTGLPVHQLFDEIWCSSIGSMIAALLTTPPSPLSAWEVTEFLEQSFSKPSEAVRIRGRFKELIPSSILMSDTLVPLRILSAEVTKFRWLWPIETRLKSFSSQNHGGVSLASVVSSSCTVFPVHPRAERVRGLDGQIIYCIDAGCEVCTESCMNPLFPHFLEASENLNLELSSVSLYFISNGWVRLDPNLGPFGKNLKIFNLDADLQPLIKKWKTQTRIGALFNRVSNPRLLFNLAGVGLIPAGYFKVEALTVTQDSSAYKAVVESLLGRVCVK